MKSKGLWKSKTFWVGVLGAVVEYSGFLSVVGVPSGALTYAVSGAMIALRLITQGPVHVMADAAKDP